MPPFLKKWRIGNDELGAAGQRDLRVRVFEVEAQDLSANVLVREVFLGEPRKSSISFHEDPLFGCFKSRQKQRSQTDTGSEIDCDSSAPTLSCEGGQ
jgi:hypothetical protein